LGFPFVDKIILSVTSDISGRSFRVFLKNVLAKGLTFSKNLGTRFLGDCQVKKAESFSLPLFVSSRFPTSKTKLPLVEFQQKQLAKPKLQFQKSSSPFISPLVL
jgi:hypothetical protein